VLFLTGCATSPATVVKTETVVETPPTEWLADCPVPDLAGKTNGDLLRWAASLRMSLIACNADKAALRDWQQAARSQ